MSGSDVTTTFLGNIGINGIVHRMIPGTTTIAFVVYAGLVALVSLPVLWNRFADGSHIFLIPRLSLQIFGAYCLVWVLLALREKPTVNSYPG